MIKIRGQSGEASLGKSIRDILDMTNQTPPLLNHNNPRTRTLG